MAPISAVLLRRWVREDLIACGLHGFVRIGALGKPLLLTDALRRASAEETSKSKDALTKKGFLFSEETGLLWINPSDILLHEIIGGVEKDTLRFDAWDWNSPLSEAGSLAKRLMQDPLSFQWTQEGTALILEAIRLPDPQPDGWPEVDLLRPMAAELMRKQDRTALHAAGILLAARICNPEKKKD